MEMLKLLGEAKANGLSKEEFLHLVDLEVKMNESKKQNSGSGGSGSGIVGIEKLLQEACDKLENQQKCQYQNLEQSVKDLLEQQKQQMQVQFKQLQQQQESQNQHLQQFQQQIQHQYVQLQQQIQLQLLSKQQKDFHKQDTQASDDMMSRNLDEAVLNMKDRFHEMRTTVLNRLEEEKIFMRDALSKAQNDILTLLSKTGEDVSHMKEVVDMDVFTRIGKQIGHVQQLIEEEIQIRTKEKAWLTDQREAEGNYQVTHDSLKSFAEDLESKIENKLEKAVGGLKKDFQEVQESFVAAMVPDTKENQKSSPSKPDNCCFYDFCINYFRKVSSRDVCHECKPFYIDKLGASVTGFVQFESGYMQVWFRGVRDPGGYDRNVRVFLDIGVKVIVTAAVIPVTADLPEKFVGEKSLDLDRNFLDNEHPVMIGHISCNEISKKGYVMAKEGAVLLRYKILLLDG